MKSPRRFNRLPGLVLRFGAVLGDCPALGKSPRLASVCAPWRAFILSVVNYTAYGLKRLKTAFNGLVACGRKNTPEGLRLSGAVCYLWNSFFFLRPMVYNALPFCVLYHRYIIELQACRGHVIALTVTGQEFAPGTL